MNALRRLTEDTKASRGIRRAHKKQLASALEKLQDQQDELHALSRADSQPELTGNTNSKAANGIESNECRIFSNIRTSKWTISQAFTLAEAFCTCTEAPTHNCWWQPGTTGLIMSIFLVNLLHQQISPVKMTVAYSAPNTPHGSQVDISEPVHIPFSELRTAIGARARSIDNREVTF